MASGSHSSCRRRLRRQHQRLDDQPAALLRKHRVALLEHLVGDAVDAPRRLAAIAEWLDDGIGARGDGREARARQVDPMQQANRVNHLLLHVGIGRLGVDFEQHVGLRRTVGSGRRHDFHRARRALLVAEGDGRDLDAARRPRHRAQHPGGAVLAAAVDPADRSLAVAPQDLEIRLERREVRLAAVTNDLEHELAGLVGDDRIGRHLERHLGRGERGQQARQHDEQGAWPRVQSLPECAWTVGRHHRSPSYGTSP